VAKAISFDRWLLALALGLLLVGISRDQFDLWVAKTDLPALLSETSVEVRDRNGQLLRVYTVADGRWRLGVIPDQVDPRLIEMLISYEDRRFHDHAGVDLRAMVRASAQAIWHGEVVSGGSTLTMQVARLLEETGTGRLKGKLRQMRVAWALERKLSKDQILRLYLIHAPYGGNLEGVRAATLAWFGKEPTRLTPAEAALLVALPQAPEHRRPDRNRAAAEVARDRVLTRMVRNRVLDEETKRAALSEPVPARRQNFPALAAHLADQSVAEAPEALRHDLTVDSELQRKLEALAKGAMRGMGDDLSVAIVVADHQTGEVLASVGSAGYGTETARQGFVDMTRAKRSPGSTLKPLVYAMAFDRGLVHPQTLINDRPVAFGRYAPQNFDGAFRGEIPVAEALRQSLNIPVVLLLDQIGPAHLMSLMRRTAVEPDLPGDDAGLAVALGGVGLSLNDLVQLYAMLAQGGQAQGLRWRQDAAESTRAEVLSRVSAWQVSDILSTLAPPTGAPQRRLAYKTGTSYGHRDAWAIGFDGRHVAGVWIGRPDGTPVPGAFGGDLAAPILFEAFQRLKPETEPLPPPPPETLILSTAELPRPLKRFAGRDALFQAAPDAPKLIFPPDGAILAVDDGVAAKVRDGIPPFTWLADGKPVMLGAHRREVLLPLTGKGYSLLSVIDAQGRTSRVTVEFR
jgi:penicillin-binding protein 1C